MVHSYTREMIAFFHIINYETVLGDLNQIKNEHPCRIIGVLATSTRLMDADFNDKDKSQFNR